MRLCPDNANAADTLESLAAVTTFLGAALTARDEPWNDTAELWGARLVFDALAADSASFSPVPVPV